MIVIIAGGIGSGKSEVMKLLRDLGAEIVISDEINRQLLQDKEYIDTINKNFPGTVKNGVIDKKTLRNIIFNDEKERLKLNSIAHPQIFKRINDITKNLRLVFVEVPLFNETSMHINYDKLCAVKASYDTRVKRVALRDNISYESAKKILDAQVKEESIYKKADYVIINDGDLRSLEEQVIGLYNELK